MECSKWWKASEISKHILYIVFEISDKWNNEQQQQKEEDG